MSIKNSVLSECDSYRFENKKSLFGWTSPTLLTPPAPNDAGSAPPSIYLLAAHQPLRSQDPSSRFQIYRSMGIGLPPRCSLPPLFLARRSVGRSKFRRWEEDPGTGSSNDEATRSSYLDAARKALSATPPPSAGAPTRRRALPPRREPIWCVQGGSEAKIIF